MVFKLFHIGHLSCGQTKSQKSVSFKKIIRLLKGYEANTRFILVKKI